MSLKEALAFAEAAHSTTKWKKTDRSFLYHPMGVASLVLRFQGTEAQAIAALIHDTLETTDLKTIETRFGSQVKSIVDAFTDPPLPEGYPSDWATLKKAYLEKVSLAEEQSLFVILCEELHELGEILWDLRTEGQAMWSRYAVPGRDYAWYYRRLVEISYKRLLDPKYKGLLTELARQTRTLVLHVHESTNL